MTINDQISTSLLHSDKAPNCDLYFDFVRTVNDCLRTAPYTRLQIAERMNLALQAPEEIDQTKLNKWFAPSQSLNIPMYYLPALLWATNSIEIVNTLLQPLMFKAVDQRAQMLQKHAELQVENEKNAILQKEIIDTLLTSGTE
ncbi:hypothetical protein CJF42_26310 [Pseudoalteromonas sp. NBT06-2]|uniref:hypothetical protein n=1 Tax=Pseudoalteromonas sp. NBT06-2 TaxID=2025950 RepID=UPI000BA510BC|nr:hypothetical protein [Pseudoalteromonas sp. NBT06-2]PAJ68330.1 hypothetical protein CJF42_26310 [Pseudoalteromonas sp. NBT06-2]